MLPELCDSATLHFWRRGWDMSEPKYGRFFEPFIPESESISSYLERADLYLRASGVREERTVAVFLSAVGLTAYTVLRDLCRPELPETKSYDELKRMLKQQYEPKPLVIAERYYFGQRNQAPGESIADYVAELRRMSAHCEYGNFLDQALRDRLVAGLRSEVLQRQLLSEEDLTLKQAIQRAQAFEAAETNSKALKGSEPTVQKVAAKSSPAVFPPCFRCGRDNHQPEECRFRNAKCHNCGRTGHISPVCRSSGRASGRFRRDDCKSRYKKRQSTVRNKWIAGRDTEETSDSDELPILPIRGSGASRPYHVDLLVDDQPLHMELDTGAAVSIISESQQRAVFPSATLEKSDMLLKTYTGECMSVVGEMHVDVQYSEQRKPLTLIVVEGDGPPLLGRNWLEHLTLDWKSIGSVSSNKETARALEELLSSHSAVFRDELGTVQPFRAKLHVQPGARPKFCKARPIPYAIKGAIDRELDRLESAGIIQSVPYSDWAAPIVAVPKGDGRFRICGDYKVTVNPVLDIDQYPLPKAQDLFSSLAGGRKFTKLDLSQAYLQVMLEEESRQYLTINTHRGLYQFLRMPFGVASAPAIFQKTMDQVLLGIPAVSCYIDDILITGANDAEHLQNLARVLDRLAHHGMTVKREKCLFMKQSVEFLGYRIDAEGTHPTADKLKAVKRAPTPRNVQELRSFLGLINYYGNFIPNLSTLLHPLNRLLQHDTKWNWTPECAEAFKSAKEMLTSSSVLVHYDPSLPLRVAADASASGLGAVLSHVMPDDTERPVAFASRTLSATEKKYAQVEKEALGLIFAVKKFHSYLYGRRFTLLTDHKPLLAILGPKKAIPALAAARLQRWAILLSAYSYDIAYKSSSNHNNADGLSRLPLPESDCTSSIPSCFNLAQIQALPVSSTSIQRASRTDPILSKVIQYTRKGWPVRVSDAFKPFSTRRNELTVEGNCLLWGTRVVIPKRLQATLLEELHRDHPGVSRMKALARSYLWWPNLDREIESCVKQCEPCQAVKGNPAPAPLHPWIWPTRPWMRVHLDFAGPFYGKMFLISVDAHSKWPEVVEMSNTTAQKTIDELRKLFAAYGLPEQIVTDNGPQFTADEFTHFLKENGVKHIRCSPYHPSSNGAAERFVKTFKQAMKAGHRDGRSLQHRLANFLLTYRTTPHATTNEAPCLLFQGRSLRTRLDLIRPNLQKTVSDKQAVQKSNHDGCSILRDLYVGQSVLVRNLRPGLDWLRGTIVRKLGPLSYLVELDDGRLWKRHIDHIKVLQKQKPSRPSVDEQCDPSLPVTTSCQEESSPELPSEPEPTPASATQAEPSSSPSGPTDSPTSLDSHTRRYPLRTRRSPDRYCDTYMHT